MLEAQYNAVLQPLCSQMQCTGPTHAQTRHAKKRSIQFSSCWSQCKSCSVQKQGENPQRCVVEPSVSPRQVAVTKQWKGSIRRCAVNQENRNVAACMHGQTLEIYTPTRAQAEYNQYSGCPCTARYFWTKSPLEEPQTHPFPKPSKLGQLRYPS